MKKYLFLMCTFFAVLPAFTFATSMYSSTEADSDSGGNSVGSGGTVVTGSSDASVHAVNIVNGGNGGTSTVDITTTVNGQVHHETITKTIPKGGSAIIEVATSSTSVGTKNTNSTSAVHIDIRVDAGKASASSTSRVEITDGTTTASSSDHVFSFSDFNPVGKIIAWLQSFLALFGF